MTLWKMTDDANSSPLTAVKQFNLQVNTANRDALYGNTTEDAFVAGQTVGVYAVDSTEIKASGGKSAHTGWILRKEGTGGRAGRVMEEVLVAGGITSDAAGGADNTKYPQYVITIDNQPVSLSVNSAQATVASFTVNAHSTPNTNFAYQWQYRLANGTFVNVSSNSIYSNVTTKTLYIANTDGLDNTKYQCFLSASGAATVTSSQVTLTVT